MGKITLEQLLQYFDEQTVPKYGIQIVMPNEEWDCATEMWVGSELLKPFMKYFVQEIDYEYHALNTWLNMHCSRG